MKLRSIGKTWISLMLLLALVMVQFPAPVAQAAAAPVYRALLIGNQNYGNSGSLDAPVGDVTNMKNALAMSIGAKYSKIDVKLNQTKQGMADALTAASTWGQTENDVTLIYYSGHGFNVAGGGINGVDHGYLYFADIESLVARIQGKVIIILDSCHSGGLIGKSATDSLKKFNAAAVNAFSSANMTAKALSGPKYHVITASKYVQESVELGFGYPQGWVFFGLFTAVIQESMGWDRLGAMALPGSAMEGDANSDSILTITEAYQYVVDYFKANRATLENMVGSPIPQEVQMSPAGSDLPLVARKALVADPVPEPIVPEPIVPEPIIPEPIIHPTLPNLKNALLAPGGVITMNDGGKSLKWTSSKKSVAVVSTEGIVRALKTGKAVIYGKIGSKVHVTMNVEVASKSKVPQEVSLNYSGYGAAVGHKVKFKGRIYPSASKNKTIRWYSSDKKVAKIDSSGKMTMLAPGKAIIYGISASGVYDTCEVRVEPREVDKIRQSTTKVNVKVGKSVRLKATIFPSYASDKTMTWISEDDSIATVSKKGLVTGIKKGKVYITVQASNGKRHKALITVK